MGITSLAAVLLALGTALVPAGAVARSPKLASVQCDPGKAILVSDNGQLPITVEVADDPAERAQGLMFRRALEPQHGMLFIYETPQPASFWMRNTLIPLDIIFMDATGKVRHIQPNARPLDETPIPGAAVGDPDPLRLFVLEIGGGEAERLGIYTGQVMAYPAIDPAQAAISCE